MRLPTIIITLSLFFGQHAISQQPPSSETDAGVAETPGRLIGFGTFPDGSSVTDSLPDGAEAEGFVQVISTAPGNGWLALKADGTERWSDVGRHRFLRCPGEDHPDRGDLASHRRGDRRE